MLLIFGDKLTAWNILRPVLNGVCALRATPVSLFALAAGVFGAGESFAEWKFTDVSEEAGAAHAHGFLTSEERGTRMMSGGVAAGDYDRDGDVDLYIITGDIAPNVLLENDGEGRFADRTEETGTGLPGHLDRCVLDPAACRQRVR